MVSRNRPTRIGKYSITGRLGSGGMSKVYRAIADDSDTEVALKVTPIKNEVDVSVADFQMEIVVGRRVKHTNVVPTLDHGCKDGHIYLAMPIIDGATLSNSTRLRDPSRRPSSSKSSAYKDSWIVPMLHRQWQQIARIGMQMSGALAACHSGGVIHKDIKPGNIIMNRNGDSFLMDFGLAWIRRGPKGQQLCDKAGTSRYLPPEVFNEQRDERSDIYSLGLTLHELLTGQKPWGEVDHETMKTIRPDLTVPRLSTLMSDIPERLANCIDIACSNLPDERHQHAHLLEQEFAEIHDELSSDGDLWAGGQTFCLPQLPSIVGSEMLTADVWFGDAC
ncbi:MAG: serine/threonine-protein kinase [Fuerstiella sp.]